MALAREGVEVTIAARDPERLAQAAARIRDATAVRVMPVAAAFRTAAGREAALAVCPTPDILVTRAEGSPPGDFRDHSHADWVAAIEDMMLGPIELMKRTVDGMIARHFGRIVNVVSRSVRSPQGDLPLSNGARAGRVGFVAGLARQAVARDVTINNLLPGIFASDAQRRHVQAPVSLTGRTFDDIWAERARANPAGPYGDPVELGAACAYRCSARAGYITGQNLLVDGGGYPGVSERGSDMRRLAALFLGRVFAGAANAQYPAKPVRIVVPYPPRGTVDVVARSLAQQLTVQTGQQLIVDHRAGANGTIGSEFVSKAPPDGYTLLVQASIFVNPLFLKNVPYDVQRGFTPVANVGSVPLLVGAHPSVSAATLREFVALVRAHPDRHTFARTGLGFAGHLTEEVIKCDAGLQILIVPHNGPGPALTDIVGGQVSALADPLPSPFPHVKGGRLKALAVTNRERVAFMAGVPTMAETGFPGFEMLA